LGTFGVALFLYFFAIVPAYWDVEFEVHSAIWSAFAKAPSEMEFKDIIPCKKLIIQALGKRESAKELEEGLEQQQQIPKSAK
jgi:hypothetical protein